jgi:hypothetical protein
MSDTTLLRLRALADAMQGPLDGINALDRASEAFSKRQQGRARQWERDAAALRELADAMSRLDRDVASTLGTTGRFGSAGALGGAGASAVQGIGNLAGLFGAEVAGRARGRRSRALPRRGPAASYQAAARARRTSERAHRRALSDQRAAERARRPLARASRAGDRIYSQGLWVSTVREHPEARRRRPNPQARNWAGHPDSIRGADPGSRPSSPLRSSSGSSGSSGSGSGSGGGIIDWLLDKAAVVFGQGSNRPLQVPIPSAINKILGYGGLLTEALSFKLGGSGPGRYLAAAQALGRGRGLGFLLRAFPPTGRALALTDLYLTTEAYFGGEASLGQVVAAAASTIPGLSEVKTVYDLLKDRAGVFNWAKARGVFNGPHVIMPPPVTSTPLIPTGPLQGLGNLAGSLLSFARGGRVAHSTTALVGERGPEIVQLPGGANVIPAHRSRSALQHAGAGASPVRARRDLHVHQHLDGREIARATLRNLDDDEQWGRR